MSRRRLPRFRPGLEPLEHRVGLSSGAHPAAAHQAIVPNTKKPLHGYLVFRITQPNQYNDKIVGPMGQVLVQATQPVPRQVYNVLYVTVRNGTLKTFTAADGFTVRFPGQATPTPILTGNEQWLPGQNYTFYVLTKKYYPINNQVAGGFLFDMGGAKSTIVPGPSGIFLRVTYNPATFPKTLDWIVLHGAGAQGGIGITYGLPDTAINEFLPAITHRKDFGGYF